MVSQILERLHSAKVRLGLAFLLSSLLLLPVANVYAAGSANGSTVTPTNSDICVDGTVIDHEEEPLADGRIVTATAPDGTAIAALVDEDGEFSFEDGLYPGNWTFTIDVVKEGEEWEAVTPASFKVTLDYSQSDCYQIRFKLRRVVTVIVIKIDENHNRLVDWEIKATPASDNVFAVSQEATTDANGEAIFRLSEGNWIFTEYPPEDVSYEPVVPTNGRQELEVEAPGPYTIRFKNRLNIYGCIDVLKQDVPPVDSMDTPFPLQGWKINLLKADGTLAASGVTDALGTISFEKLAYGPYTVVEEERVGWESATVTSYDVELMPSQSACAQVVFDNAQADPEYCIEGRKLDANGKIGLPGWTITAEPLDKGDEDPDDVVTDGLGMYKFTFSGNDYRVPGSRYQICEDYDDVDGWVPSGPTCYTVTIPQQPGACVQVPSFVNQQVGHGETVSTPSTPTGCSKVHTVKKGETLYGIGYKYGVSSKAILSANTWVNSQPHLFVYVGQQVCIP
ncbi:MAG: LysM peptidoglycan-binding domain-containing protein [Caldilineaceae bacterium]|nr:LysM peptidoglycan-binding domain-containing protein [Caldilineaceae bacterium]